MLVVQSVVADINRRTGESECQYYKERLLYTGEGQRDELIDLSKTLSCHGELKNNRGLVSRSHLLSFIAVALSSYQASLLLLPVLLLVKNRKNPGPHTPHASLPVVAEAPRVSLPGRPGHHQVRLVQRSAGQLPAVPPANSNKAAGPGGPFRWRDESGRVHKGGLQQHRAESVHRRQH